MIYFFQWSTEVVDAWQSRGVNLQKHYKNGYRQQQQKVSHHQSQTSCVTSVFLSDMFACDYRITFQWSNLCNDLKARTKYQLWVWDIMFTFQILSFKSAESSVLLSRHLLMLDSLYWLMVYWEGCNCRFQRDLSRSVRSGGRKTTTMIWNWMKVA